MVRNCQSLELPDPEIKPVPNVKTIEVESDVYVEHVVERWRLPLANVRDEQLEPTTYTPGETRWWMEGRLEHAVMHPIRHEFQLKELMHPSEKLGNYTSRGARALVLLHEQHLRQCLEVWKQAKAANLSLPVTDEEKYQSLENLLSHSLSSARKYMIRMCNYLEHLLERWRLPLADVPDEKLEPEVYIPGKTPYWIDVMLEHAVMHPIRHEFRLKELMQRQALTS
jgi:hypothetical protein